MPVPNLLSWRRVTTRPTLLRGDVLIEAVDMSHGTAFTDPLRKRTKKEISRIVLLSFHTTSLFTVFLINFSGDTILRDDYLKGAQEVITDPMILINVVSRRAKQLKSGYKPLIESLERLSAEDMALREIMEGKITYQLDEEVQEV